MLRYSKLWLRFNINRYKRANEINKSEQRVHFRYSGMVKKPYYLGLYVLLRYREGFAIPYGEGNKKVRT